MASPFATMKKSTEPLEKVVILVESCSVMQSQGRNAEAEQPLAGVEESARNTFTGSYSSWLAKLLMGLGLAPRVGKIDHGAVLCDVCLDLSLIDPRSVENWIDLARDPHFIGVKRRHKNPIGLSEEHMSGRQIAGIGPLLVGGLKGLGDLEDNGERLLDRDRSPGAMPERKIRFDGRRRDDVVGSPERTVGECHPLDPSERVGIPVGCGTLDVGVPCVPRSPERRQPEVEIDSEWA